MANPNAVHEPSMEEILASIRQIISEDGGSAAPKIDGVIAEPARMVRPEIAAPDPAPAEQIAAAPIDDARVEPEPAFAPEPDFGGYMRPQAFEDAEASEPEEPPVPLRSPLIAPRALRDDEEDPLLSPESGDAISGAFGALAHTLLAHNHTRTLEGVVTEMLQPMLKQWLDDNLPSIVERKVQEEIERVSRGRR